MVEMISLIGLFYAPLPIILYIIARWRDNRAEQPDPQLGYKFGLHLFKFVSVQTLIVATVAVTAATFFGMTYARFEWEIYQAAIGFSIPAVVVFLYSNKMLDETNDKTNPAVARLFSGLLWVLLSVAILIAFTFMSVMITMGELNKYMWQFPIATLLIGVPVFHYYGKGVKQFSS